MNDEEPFLKRWSRRKSESKEQGPADEGSPAADTGAGAAALAPVHPDQDASEHAGPQEKRVLTEDDFADVDFDALNVQSDYARFLADGVPDSIKYKALRKLWASDPIFYQVDPFQDYAGDFTDAAVAVPAGTLKTAYRVGRGFMSDEDLAEWEKLGKPVEEKSADAPVPATDAQEQVAHDAAGVGDPATGQPADAGADERQRTADADRSARDGAEAKDDAAARPAVAATGSAGDADKDKGAGEA